MFKKNNFFFEWKRNLQDDIESGSTIADTDTGPIEYALYGKSGPVVVCTHGAPGGYDQVLPFFSDLLGEGFRVLAWSRPGYLRTPLSVGKTVNEQARALLALLDYLNIEQPSVVGISAGGPPSIQFAAMYPERINKLVTICAVSKSYNMGVEKKLLQLLSHIVASDPVLWLYNLFVDHWAQPAIYMMIRTESTLNEMDVQILVDSIMKDEKKYNLMIELIRSMSPISLRKAGLDNDIEKYTNLDPLDFDKVQAPCLVFHGTHDAVVPMEHARHIAKKVKNSQLHWIQKGIHILPVSENAHKMAEYLSAFLKES